jgi:hypothetical protein
MSRRSGAFVSVADNAMSSLAVAAATTSSRTPWSMRALCATTLAAHTAVAPIE